MKLKKCRVCKKDFRQMNSTVVWCSPSCGYKLYQTKQSQKNRQNKKRFYQNDPATLKSKCQKIANKIGKQRQFLKNRYFCVTCDKQANKYDGGHCFNTAVYGAIRYDVRQIQPQCVNCNRYNAGQPVIYEQKLREQYGDELVDWWKSQKNVIVRRSNDYYQRYIFVMGKRSRQLELRLQSKV